MQLNKKFHVFLLTTFNMNTKELLDRVFFRLKEEDYLRDFKFKRNESEFVHLKEDKFYKIGIEHYDTVESHDNPRLGLNLCLYFANRYDILHNWFEKYSMLSLEILRYESSFSYTPKNLGLDDMNFFSFDGDDFETAYDSFLNEIITGADYFFNRVNSLKKCYENYIVPAIESSSSVLPDEGSQWVLKYLALARIVAPENYALIKSLIMERVDYMIKRNEPNIILYKDTMPEICAFLESIDFRGINVN